MRRLELPAKYHTIEAIYDWDPLILYAQQKQLLPNLERITYSPVSISHLHWLTIFLSPTLLNIQHTDLPRSPSINIGRASALLETIKIRCPALKELSLHPAFGEELTRREGGILPISPIYESYSSLQSVRVLSTTMNFSDTSALLALARLPRLETLEISEAYYCSDPVPAITLPDGSFPALRNLLLPELTVGEITTIWNIPQLVSMLSRVRATVAGIENASDGGLVFRSICTHSPHMLDLELELNECELVRFGSFASLTMLSLEKLSVDTVGFFSLSVPCEILAGACPLLRELRLPSTDTSILDLQRVAQLSRLEYLNVCIDWETCVEVDEAIAEPLFVSRVFRRLEGGSMNNAITPAQVQRTIL